MVAVLIKLLYIFHRLRADSQGATTKQLVCGSSPSHAESYMDLNPWLGASY